MMARHWRLAAAPATGIALALGGVSLVQAHGGVEPGQNPLTAWNTNPLPSLLIFLAAYLYVTGLSRWSRPSHPVKFWQKTCFFSGLLAIFLALQSPIDPLADHLFFVHQIQHLLLRMIGPLLVLLGAPLTPMLRGLPTWALQGLVRPLVRHPSARQGYFFLTNPVTAGLLFLAALYLWQIPGPHDFAVRHGAVHQLMHLTMLFSGFLFWWLIIDPLPHRSRLHYGLRVLYVGLLVIPNTVLGAAIAFQGEPVYAAYGEVERLFNISLLTDQQLGGLMLWVPGDMMSIVAAGIVMIMWYQREQQIEQLDAAS